MARDENNKTEPNAEINPAGNEGDKLFRDIVALSVKTLFYLLLIISVSLASFSRVFPFSAMKFYSDMENYKMAVRYARDYTKRDGKHYYQAVFEGVKMSEELLFDAKTDADRLYAAEYLLYFSEKFAALDDFDARCEDLDYYYNKNAASLPEKIGLYSFKDYIFCKHAAASSVLNKTDKLMYDGSFEPISEKGYITADELNEMLRKIINGKFPPQLADLAIIFNQLSENVIWGGGELIFDGKTNDTTSLYDLLLLVMQNEQGFSYTDEVLKLSGGIKRLYYMQAAAVLGENVKEFFDSVDGWEGKTQKIAELQQVFSVLADGETIPLYDFYRAELLNS